MAKRAASSAASAVKRPRTKVEAEPGTTEDLLRMVEFAVSIVDTGAVLGLNAARRVLHGLLAFAMLAKDEAPGFDPVKHTLMCDLLTNTPALFEAIWQMADPVKRVDKTKAKAEEKCAAKIKTMRDIIFALCVGGEGSKPCSVEARMPDNVLDIFEGLVRSRLGPPPANGVNPTVVMDMGVDFVLYRCVRVRARASSSGSSWCVCVARLTGRRALPRPRLQEGKQGARARPR